ncbi:hypothetical protein ACFLZV_01380 [Candidatus Margulisiibacteriota bacterium]
MSMRKNSCKLFANFSILAILLIFLMPVLIYPFAEKPTFEKEMTAPTSSKLESLLEEQKAQEEVEAAPELTDEEIYDLEQRYQRALKLKQFGKALEYIEKIPEKKLSSKIIEEITKLKLFKKIEDEEKESTSAFAKEEDLGPDLEKTVKRLYREAQYAYMNDKEKLCEDILIQMLFLHRRNFKARKVLEYGLDMKIGSYTVENIEEKYWRLSNVFFYGGNYINAVEALKVLSFIDNENPEVYKRMGSSYYMMGEKKDAIAAWNTALFYRPNDPELKKVVAKAEKLVKLDVAKAKERRLQKEKRKKKVVVQVDTVLLGTYNSQKEAFNYAAKVRKEGLKPIIEELDNGKWAVKIPKKAATKK